ncbi:hypothetical protein IFM89_027380, partial [Coptis chinensis]
MAQTTPNHTQTVSGWAALDNSGKITPYTFKRRENGVDDVTIEILYCGICHTDLHYAKDDWGITMYPVVPGTRKRTTVTISNLRTMAFFWDGSITYGGYSNMIVADQRYVVHVPENLPMDSAAPLLCAGITVFTPMKDNDMLNSPGKKLGVVGLGGLGHVAVKFGKAFGLHVTVISTSPSKEREAKERLGADGFIVSTDTEQME